jgi:hypothetical protein
MSIYHETFFNPPFYPILVLGSSFNPQKNQYNSGIKIFTVPERKQNGSFYTGFIVYGILGVFNINDRAWVKIFWIFFWSLSVAV